MIQITVLLRLTFCQNITTELLAWSQQCGAGYRLDERGSCLDINECETGSCPQETSCTNTIGSFYCSCQPGTKYNHKHDRCDDINECETSPCHHSCRNYFGGFECTCNEGFKVGSFNYILFYGYSALY